MTRQFNNSQLKSFFISSTQIALSSAQRSRLATKGLVTIDDFEDFKEDQLEQVVKNLRVSTSSASPEFISARCMRRLKVASLAYHYYSSIERSITPSNMHYKRVLRAFYQEWEALISLLKEDNPDVPVLSKHVTPMKWLGLFRDCVSRTFGVRKAPLFYIIRKNVDTPSEEDDSLKINSAFSATSESIFKELELRITHSHPSFCSNNGILYSMLEEATRSTVYSLTIKPYNRIKDGRAAYLALMSSRAGKDKEDRIQKEITSFLMNVKWNGRQYSLEKFANFHRSNFIQLQECQLHVNLQLPTEHKQVGYLIDNIINSDPDLRAVLGNICLNQAGMCSDFEAAVAYMLPVCPYAKHKSSN